MNGIFVPLCVFLEMCLAIDFYHVVIIGLALGKAYNIGRDVR